MERLIDRYFKLTRTNLLKQECWAPTPSSRCLHHRREPQILAQAECRRKAWFRNLRLRRRRDAGDGLYANYPSRWHGNVFECLLYLLGLHRDACSVRTALA